MAKTKKTAKVAGSSSTVVAKNILKDIKNFAEKLKRVPEKHEYFAEGNFPEWQIRKHFGGWAKAVSEAGVLKFIDPEVSSLNDLMVKLTRLKRDNAVLEKQVDSLHEEALSSNKLQGLIKGIGSIERGDASWLTPKKIEKTKGIPVLFLSDIHFDEVVRPEQIQGLNDYNRQICIDRLHHTFNTAIHLLTEEIKNPQYDGMVLMLGGDLLSGNIHEELAENNEAQILQSCVALLDVLIAGTNKLVEKFGKVFIPCVVGNHGRIHKKPRCKNRVFDNYEWIIYTFLQRHFANDKRVTVAVPDGSDIQFQIYNKTILLTHGDQFKGGNGISGIFSPLMLGMSRKQKRNASVKRPFDLMCCGHFHQLIMTPSLLINGSVKGYDEYAFQNNFGYEPPQQALFIVHPRLGITHQMPILCDGFTLKEDSRAEGVLKVW